MLSNNENVCVLIKYVMADVNFKKKNAACTSAKAFKLNDKTGCLSLSSQTAHMRISQFWLRYHQENTVYQCLAKSL